jgi:hypothetical protein
MPFEREAAAILVFRRRPIDPRWSDEQRPPNALRLLQTHPQSRTRGVKSSSITPVVDGRHRCHQHRIAVKEEEHMGGSAGMHGSWERQIRWSKSPPPASLLLPSVALPCTTARYGAQWHASQWRPSTESTARCESSSVSLLAAAGDKAGLPASADASSTPWRAAGQASGHRCVLQPRGCNAGVRGRQPRQWLTCCCVPSLHRHSSTPRKGPSPAIPSPFSGQFIVSEFTFSYK